MKRLIAFGLPAMMLRIRRRNHRTRNGSRQADSGPQESFTKFYSQGCWRR